MASNDLILVSVDDHICEPADMFDEASSAYKHKAYGIPGSHAPDPGVRVTDFNQDGLQDLLVVGQHRTERQPIAPGLGLLLYQSVSTPKGPKLHIEKGLGTPHTLYGHSNIPAP